MGVGEGGFTKLGEIPATDLPVAEPSRTPAAFAEVLARALSGKGGRNTTRDEDRG